MKTKFESNVATQIPKTRMAREPRLPWEVRKEDLIGSSFLEERSNDLIATKTLLGTRPVFLAMLLVFIFVSTFSIFLYTAQRNESARMEIERKEETQVLLLSSLEKVVDEKQVLKEKAVQLEKEIEDLNTQNKTFITVIENLSKKDEEAATEGSPAEVPSGARGVKRRTSDREGDEEKKMRKLVY